VADAAGLDESNSGLTIERWTIERWTAPDQETLALLSEYDREAFGETGLRSYDLGVVARAGALFLGLIDGEIAACCQAMRMMDEPESAWVVGFWVRPRFQGRGLGRGFLRELLGHLGEFGVRAVRLTVDPANRRARRLYAEFGFTELERIEDFYGPGEHRIVLAWDED